LRYSVLTVTPLAQNCSLVWCSQTGAGVVVDPGGEPQRIESAIREAGVRLTHILLTHAHIDHVGAAGALAEVTQAPIWGPGPQDEFLVGALQQQADLFGVKLEQPFVPQRWLCGGDSIAVGSVRLDVLHCPGHTPGHVVYHCAAGATVFTGDVLFRGSIGRTDLPGGDQRSLLASIREQLWPLGDRTTFVPGHGPTGILGDERRTNPFLR
jgi:hydroxyacylglutathione hydrolase